MKSYNEIHKDIDSIFEDIKKLEVENMRLENEYYIWVENTDSHFDKELFPIIPKEREGKDFDEYNAKRIKILKDRKDKVLKLSVLEHNAKIILFHEIIPIIIGIINEYKGRAYEEKTSGEIYDKVIQKTNCKLLLDSKRLKIKHIIDGYEIECGVIYEKVKERDLQEWRWAKHKKLLLINNIIQDFSLEDLELLNIKDIYNEDVDAVVMELKRTHAEAQEKQKELEKICKKFNTLTSLASDMGMLNPHSKINNIDLSKLEWKIKDDKRVRIKIEDIYGGIE